MHLIPKEKFFTHILVKHPNDDDDDDDDDVSMSVAVLGWWNVSLFTESELLHSPVSFNCLVQRTKVRLVSMVGFISVVCDCLCHLTCHLYGILLLLKSLR